MKPGVFYKAIFIGKKWKKDTLVLCIGVEPTFAKVLLKSGDNVQQYSVYNDEEVQFRFYKKYFEGDVLDETEQILINEYNNINELTTQI